MAEIKISINRTFNLRKLKKRLPKVTTLILNDIADSTVIDLRKRGQKGIGINGPLTKLKQQTIKQKRKEGLPKPSTPLYGSGRMTQGAFVKSRKKSKVTIGVPKDREDILTYHQEGAGNLPVRKWFGLSKKHTKKITKIAKIHFRKMMSKI
ncbi:MAG: hypothetical protein H8D94_01290 [Candidatus Pelagibacter sp.]|nr:hypothetical protein [Candidatus Pelagibacter sp.]